jgi:hypothetical protein
LEVYDVPSPTWLHAHAGHRAAADPRPEPPEPGQGVPRHVRADHHAAAASAP